MLKTRVADKPFALGAVSMNLTDRDINDTPGFYAAKHVTSLDLSNNQLWGLFDSGEGGFVNLVCQHQQMTTLKLANNKINGLNIAPICNILFKNTSLTEFDLSDNVLGNQGVNDILNALIQNKDSRIQVLRLVNTAFDAIDSELLPALSEDLKHLQLTALDLSQNRLDGEGTLEAIMDLVKNQQSLQTLKLARTHLTDAAVAQLANGVAEHKSLVELDISETLHRLTEVTILDLVKAAAKRAQRLKDNGQKGGSQSFKLCLGQINKQLKTAIKQALVDSEASEAIEISYWVKSVDRVKWFKPAPRPIGAENNTNPENSTKTSPDANDVKHLEENRGTKSNTMMM